MGEGSTSGTSGPASREKRERLTAPGACPNNALERANNIAQALVPGAGSATEVALDMLRNTAMDDKLKITVEIGSAWMSS